MKQSEVKNYPVDDLVKASRGKKSRHSDLKIAHRLRLENPLK